MDKELEAFPGRMYTRNVGEMKKFLEDFPDDYEIRFFPNEEQKGYISFMGLVGGTEEAGHFLIVNALSKEFREKLKI